MNKLLLFSPVLLALTTFSETEKISNYFGTVESGGVLCFYQCVSSLTGMEFTQHYVIIYEYNLANCLIAKAET